MENLPPFYIGQKVVAKEDHEKGFFTKGQEFVVREVKRPCCNWEIRIDVNVSEFAGAICPNCFKISRPEPFFRHSRFSPVEENFQSITLEKVLETETPLVSAN